MTAWVIENERKMDQDKPILHLTVKEGLSGAEIGASVQRLIGETPVWVKSLPGGVYEVQFRSEEIAKKMLELHGRTIRGSTRPLQVRGVEHQLKILEMFDLIQRKLVTKEKIDMCHQGKDRNERGVRRTEAKKVEKPPKMDPNTQESGGKKENPPLSNCAVPAPPSSACLTGFDPPTAGAAQPTGEPGQGKGGGKSWGKGNTWWTPPNPQPPSWQEGKGDSWWGSYQGNQSWGGASSSNAKGGQWGKGKGGKSFGKGNDGFGGKGKGGRGVPKLARELVQTPSFLSAQRDASGFGQGWVGPTLVDLGGRKPGRGRVVGSAEN